MHAFYRSTTAVAAATRLVAGGLAEASTAQARGAPRHRRHRRAGQPPDRGRPAQRHRLHLRELRRGAGQEAARATAQGGLPRREGHRGRRGHRCRNGAFTLTVAAARAPTTRSRMHRTAGKVTAVREHSAPSRRNHNPDQGVVYGFRDISDELRCPRCRRSSARRSTRHRGHPPLQHDPRRPGDLRRRGRGQRHPEGPRSGQISPRGPAAGAADGHARGRPRPPACPACIVGHRLLVRAGARPTSSGVRHGSSYVSTLTAVTEDRASAAVARLPASPVRRVR